MEFHYYLLAIGLGLTITWIVTRKHRKKKKKD